MFPDPFSFYTSFCFADTAENEAVEDFDYYVDSFAVFWDWFRSASFAFRSCTKLLSALGQTVENPLSQ